MRRKRRGDSAVVDEPDRELMRHIRALGLKSVDAYRQWCVDNGFGRGLHKHWKVRAREQFHATRIVAESRRSQKKRERRKPAEVIRGICEGTVREADVTQPQLRAICRAVSAGGRGHAQAETLASLVLHVQSHANLLSSHPVIEAFGHQAGNTYAEALTRIAAHRAWWLRDMERWKPRTHNTRRQFASLLRHLLARYDMPAFFDTVWFAGQNAAASQSQQWYIQVAQGKNIRTCELPIPYTTKMSHFFMQAPGDITVYQALRWGQIRGLGGDERLARAVLGTRIGDRFGHEDFWITVLRWLIAHPMLDTACVGPLVDYLHQQRFVPQPAAGREGREAMLPPQPNLTMKGRTPATLLRQVQQWHRRLATDNTYQVAEWNRSGIEPFEFLEGSEQSGNIQCWTIRELLSAKALFVEGRAMRHCVASYATSCARGTSSIWSLEIETNTGRSKALTVEVRNTARIICQARGKTNRVPTTKERDILRRWAAQAGLTIATYV
jgi:hypothetical protein